MDKIKLRPVLAGLLLLMLAGLAGLAFAGATQTSDKPLASQAILFNFKRGSRTIDSSAVTTSDNSITAARIDTTEEVDLRFAHYRGPYGLWVPPILAAAAGSGGWGIADTMWAFQLQMETVHGDTITNSDSNYTVVQGSPDGVTWTSIDTLGISNKLQFNLTTAASKGVISADFQTTLRGVGTKRINWDRPAVGFIRLIHTHDVAETPGKGYYFVLNARR